MKKVLRLLSVQLWAVLLDMLSLGNAPKKKPKLLFGGIIIFILAMSVISFFYCYMIGMGLLMYDSVDILPAMMMAITCLIVIMTTVFKIKGTIFGFKDYDMVMSLPISTGGIVASRLMILYAMNMVFVFIIMVPMTVAYGILTNPGIQFYVISVFAILAMPLVPIVIASILGTIIAYIASKFRHNNLLSIILSMGLLAFFVVASTTIKDDAQQMVDIGKSLTNQVNSIYPLANMYTKAVVEYNISSLLLFLGISVLAFIIYTIIVKKIFKRMNTLMMTGSYHAIYKKHGVKQSSPLKALYKKEMKRYFSSSLYVLNTGFGIVMLTIATIAAAVVDIDKVLGGPEAAAVLIKSAPVFVSFCIVMSCTTMSSISLEGKSLWVLKSLPVTAKTIYLAKIAVNLTIISPAILDSLFLGIFLKLGFLQTLFMILISISCAIFISCFGLLINLLLPNFTWTSETIVIKQSAATMIAIFAGMGVAGLLFLFMMLLPSENIAYLTYLFLILIINVSVYQVLMTYGKKRFNQL